MAYNQTGHLSGQRIEDVSTVQNHVLGTVVKAIDNTLGEGEFIYVKGVANAARGSLVVIKGDGVTALSGARSKGKLGVLMAALDADTKFGWAQIRGKSVVKYTGGTAGGAPAYFHATAGTVSNTAVAGDCVLGSQFVGDAADPGTGLAYMDIQYPAGGDFDNA